MTVTLIAVDEHALLDELHQNLCNLPAKDVRLVELLAKDSGWFMISAADASQEFSNIFESLTSVSFWLGTPFRILMIIVMALAVRGLLQIVIKQITNSVAKGTSIRIIPSKTSRRWITDDAPSNSRQAQRAKTVGSVLRNVSSIVVWTVAIVMIISELGFNIAPVIASAGVVGVALSFGAQSLVKDFLSGIFIVAEDQLGIGDFVDLGEAIGEVEAVGLRVTQVRDSNGTLWHVRNGEILRVGNSSQGWARTNIDLPVPYDADVQTLSSTLLKAANKALADPDIKSSVVDEASFVGIEKLTGESLTLRFTVKTAPSEQWTVARTMRTALKKALDDQGIRVPLANQSVVKTAPPTQAIQQVNLSENID